MTKSADAFRTISEVSAWLGVPAHVLRFWESRFPQVKPVKRAGGRRYYRPADMELLGGIRKLLHDDGLTIRGVQKILKEKGVRHVSGLSPPVCPDEPADASATTAGPVPVGAEASGTANTVKSARRRPKPDPAGTEPDDGRDAALAGQLRFDLKADTVTVVRPSQSGGEAAPASSHGAVASANRPVQVDERVPSAADVAAALRSVDSDAAARHRELLHGVADRLSTLRDRLAAEIDSAHD